MAGLGGSGKPRVGSGGYRGAPDLQQPISIGKRFLFNRRSFFDRGPPGDEGQLELSGLDRACEDNLVDSERMRRGDPRNKFCGCLPPKGRDFLNVHVKSNRDFRVAEPSCAILQNLPFAPGQRAGRGICAPFVRHARTGDPRRLSVNLKRPEGGEDPMSRPRPFSVSSTNSRTRGRPDRGV
jgi:hypothetical protein